MPCSTFEHAFSLDIWLAFAIPGGDPNDRLMFARLPAFAV